MIGRKISKLPIRYVMPVFVGIACLLLSSPAGAQLSDYKTIVTFSMPVEVPGSAPQVLPAGKYSFKVVDSKVNRNIVQISNTNESRVYTTVLTVPAHRDQETDKTVMTFEERESGKPMALREWFYPFEKQGQEFVYSNEEAGALAKTSETRAQLPVRFDGVKRQRPVKLYSRLAPEEPAPASTPISGQTSDSEPKLSQPTHNVPLYALVGCLLVVGGLSIKGLVGR